MIPVALGLVGAAGPLADATCPEVVEGVYVLDRGEAELVFEGVRETPVPSLLRDFSAPVRLDLALTDAERMRLLARDGDPFNRWQAAQDIALALILDPDADRAAAFAEALGVFLDGEAMADPAFAAQVLALPSAGEAADALPGDVDPDAIHRARCDLRANLGRALRPRLERLDAALAPAAGSPYSPDAASAGAGRCATRPST